MFTEYTGNRQFDLQLNRTFATILDRAGMETIAATTLPRLRTTSQITKLAQGLAERFSSEGDEDAAWRLHELAAFYLGADDPRKRRFIDAMSASFDEAHRSLALTRHAVPYRGGELTAMRWEADPADRAQAPAGTPTTLIMMNGFDGYVEEIIDFASHFPTRPFDVIAFDGPGQGHTVLAGMPLEPQWERPTNAVLNYFGIESAAALGVSFGGYLVTRAAAYCPRISHVIAFDMMYRLLDGLTAPLPRPLRPIADAVVGNPRPAWLIDATLRTASRLSADLGWKLQEASHLTGLSRPSEVLRAFGDYTMEPLEGRITQPCLVFAGDADQYVPFERLGDVRRALENSASLDVRAFHHAQDPDMAQHCQIGDLDRAFAIMGDWLQAAPMKSLRNSIRV
ncbi:alpha/beta fold hydrolase [Isoptericola variabilis]|uniref:alpha/beta fold hydrolase n=1 Tax=Isoptericola variabilis TaxID=139208 RepID=UPI0006610E43|nr:alpha/beta hydrolase [Isoptericola variabilis]